MVDVVVAFRDAVMATLLAWSGVGDHQLADAKSGGAAKGPAAKPAPVEKVVTEKKPTASMELRDCPNPRGSKATPI